MSRTHCWCGHKGKVRAQIWISKWWTQVDLSGGLTSCIKLRLSPVSWEGRDVICEELLSLSQRKLYSRIKVSVYHSPLLKKCKKLVIFSETLLNALEVPHKKGNATIFQRYIVQPSHSLFLVSESVMLTREHVSWVCWTVVVRSHAVEKSWQHSMWNVQLCFLEVSYSSNCWWFLRFPLTLVLHW